MSDISTNRHTVYVTKKSRYSMTLEEAFDAVLAHKGDAKIDLKLPYAGSLRLEYRGSSLDYDGGPPYQKGCDISQHETGEWCISPPLVLVHGPGIWQPFNRAEDFADYIGNLVKRREAASS